MGMLIGIIGVYFINPAKNVIYKYPTPDNSSKTVYKDKNGICYKYESTAVDCDKNEDKLKDFPLIK